MISFFLFLGILKYLAGESEDSTNTVLYSKNRIKLCTSSRYVPWLNKHIGMLDENSKIFSEESSKVHEIFELIDLNISSHTFKTKNEAPLIDECDIIINITNGREFYSNAKALLPEDQIILAIPDFMHRDILLTWDNKRLWKEWMITNGFADFIPREVDISKPIFPFILKESIAENGMGTYVIANQMDLDIKLDYLHNKKVTNYIAEEALVGMGIAQGLIYVSAHEGNVLSMLSYVQVGIKSNIQKQNFPNNIFIDGVPKNSTVLYRKLYEISMNVAHVQVVLDITKKSKYTGSYCLEYKMNATQQIKFLEFNPRICHTQTIIDKLFVNTYLPLSFAIHRKLREKIKKRIVPRYIYDKLLRRSHLAWYNNETYREMINILRSNALSGNLHITNSLYDVLNYTNALE